MMKDELLNDIKNDLILICKYVKKIYLIGSNATNLKNGRDIDLIAIVPNEISYYKFLRESCLVSAKYTQRTGKIVSIYPMREELTVLSQSQFIKNVISKGREI